MDSKLHICFCLDRNWIQYARRAIYDIILRKFPETQIKFYILFDGLIEESPFDIFNKIDGVEVVTQRLMSSFEFGKISSFSYPWLGPFKHLKFLIPNLSIFQDVKRVLYLDVDVLARQDLTDLYNTDLDGYPLGGVRNSLHLGHKDFPFNLNLCDELDSSMLLMDLPKLRNIHFSETCKALAHAPICTGDVWILKEVSKNITKLLNPKCVIPYHFITSESSAYNNILYWNLLYNTNYKSMLDLVLRSCLWHFFGDKQLMYKELPCVKTCFDLSEARLQKFLETGIVGPWSPVDDHVLYTQHGIITHQDDEKENNNETAETEPVLK